MGYFKNTDSLDPPHTSWSNWSGVSLEHQDFSKFLVDSNRLRTTGYPFPSSLQCKSSSFSFFFLCQSWGLKFRSWKWGNAKHLKPEISLKGTRREMLWIFNHVWFFCCCCTFLLFFAPWGARLFLPISLPPLFTGWNCHTVISVMTHSLDSLREPYPGCLGKWLTLIVMFNFLNVCI